MEKTVLLGTIRNARNKNIRLNSVGQNRIVKPRFTPDRNVDQSLRALPETSKSCDDHNPRLKRHLMEMVSNKPIKYRALSSKVPGSNYSAEIGKGGPGSGRVDEDGDPTNNRNYKGPGKVRAGQGGKPKSSFGRKLLAGAGTAAAVAGLFHPGTRGLAMRALRRGGGAALGGASRFGRGVSRVGRGISASAPAAGAATGAAAGKIGRALNPFQAVRNIGQGVSRAGRGISASAPAAGAAVGRAAQTLNPFRAVGNLGRGISRAGRGISASAPAAGAAVGGAVNRAGTAVIRGRSKLRSAIKPVPTFAGRQPSSQIRYKPGQRQFENIRRRFRGRQ